MPSKRKSRPSNKRKREQTSSEEESGSGDETSSSESSSEEEEEEDRTPTPKAKRKRKKSKAKAKGSGRKKQRKAPAKKRRKNKASPSDGKQNMNMGAGFTLTYTKWGNIGLKHRFWKHYFGKDQMGAKSLSVLLEKVKVLYWQPKEGEKDPASELDFWSIDFQDIHSRNTKRGSSAITVERKQPSFFCSLCLNQGRVGGMIQSH